MTSMIENPALDTWWLSFPADAQAPIGIGVTARSLDDACQLAARCAFGPWLAQAVEVRALRGVRIADLDAAHVVPKARRCSSEACGTRRRISDPQTVWSNMCV